MAGSRGHEGTGILRYQLKAISRFRARQSDW
jgi:hypothetical protein